jgi:hypothetical protein
MGYGSMIGEFGGQIAGDVSAMSNDAHVQRLLDEMRARYEALPDAEKVHYAPLLRSALNDVVEDPRYKHAENDVLDRLMELATSGGMTDADKAKLEQSKLSALDYERGVRGRDEQTMMRRGEGGSGALLSAEIAAQQGGIDRAYKGDLDTAASSSDRALQALTAGGDLASRLGGRDLQQQDAAASADDLISRFNASRADEMDMYNSSLNQRNALARLGGLDKESGMEIGNEKALGERERRRWRGYGKQAGALYDASGTGD